MARPAVRPAQHLLGVPTTGYTVNQASYDLARLRLNALISRRPGTNTYDRPAVDISPPETVTSFQPWSRGVVLTTAGCPTVDVVLEDA